MEPEMIQEFKEMEWFGSRVLKSRYTLSEHVIRFLVAGKVSIQGIETVLMTGNILEEHRNLMRATSYLITGETTDRNPLHLVCAEDVHHCLVILFAYVPVPPVWVSPTRRTFPGEDKMTESVGLCFFCGGDLVEITIGNYYYRYEGQLIVVKKLPATLCQQCGEKYLGADVGRKLNALIDEKKFSGTEVANVIDYET